MANAFFLRELDYVYFLYGLSFILLSASARLVARSGELWRPWRVLCFFGAVHGPLQWLEMAALDLGDVPALAWIRVVFMAASFLLLFEFARQAHGALTKNVPPIWIGPALVLAASAFLFSGPAEAEVAFRYLLALPAALWAALALWRYRELSPAPAWPLGLAAACMALYALAAGVLVPAANLPLARLLNLRTFFAAVGLPAAAVRAFLAATMAAALWRARLALFRGRFRGSAQTAPMPDGLRMATGMVVILTLGWFLTQAVDRRAKEKYDILTETAFEATVKSVESAMTSSDRFARFLADRLVGLTRSSPERMQNGDVDALIDSLAAAIPGSVIFLTDTSGVVTNTSDRRGPLNNQGKSKAFRPYFVQAILSGQGYAASMGASARAPDYYAAARVETPGERVLGVAVIKVALDNFGDIVRGKGVALLTDSHGVVLASTDPRYARRPLYPLEHGEFDALRQSRLYENLEVTPVLSESPAAGERIVLDGHTKRASRVSWPQSGMTLYVFDPVLETGPARLWAIVVVMLTALAHVTLTTLNQRNREDALSLADSNRRYHQMFAGSRSIQLLVDTATGVIEDANPAALAFYGLTREDMAKKHITEVNVFPAEEVRAAMDQAARTPSTFHMRHRGVRGVRDVEINCARVETRGKVLLHSIITDITDRLENERAMTELLDLNRKIIEHSPLGIIAYKAAGPCVLANQASADILGTTREKMLSQNFHDAQCGVTFGLNAEAKATLESGEACLRASHFIGGFDRRVRVDLILTPFTSSAEPHLLIIMNDVTHKFEAEQALERAKNLAEEAVRSKSQFLANVSHEIRTPMNAIMGLSHLALKTQLTPKQRDYMEKIQAAARALLGLLNDVLDLSKIEAGKFQMEARTFRLDHVLQDISNVLAVKAAEKGLELLFRLSPETPAELVGDPLRLGQVLTNLIDNAVKFTRQGEVEVRVEPAGASNGRTLMRFYVRDTGVGIPKHLQAKLFTPFTQADGSTTRQFGGTGLGLSISKSLVELMGGVIQLESEADAGSVFSFSIPFVLLGQERLFSRLSSPECRGLKALAVDDCPAALEILAADLAHLGFETRTAASGPEALEALNRNLITGERPFDLIVVDWHMPGLDGLETASRIKNNRSFEPKPKVVLLSAFDRDELAGVTSQSGVDRVALKPVLPQALAEAALSALFGQKAGPEAVVSQSEAMSARTGLEGCRVLLAEDNSINQQVAVELLRGAGLEVDLAVNGREAVDKVRRLGGQYHAVLMDVQMPVMNGLEATRIIRGRLGRTSLPIIAMTAHAMKKEIDDCLESGMTDHVAKPVEPADLLATLCKWVRPGPGRKPAQPAPAPRERDLTARLPGYPGVELEQALQRLGGNARLYRRLMDEFSAGYGGFCDEVQNDLSSARLSSAASKAHALKGVAANLGARALADAAFRLEQAVQQGDGPGCETLLVELSGHLDPILAAIRLSGPAPGGETPPWDSP